MKKVLAILSSLFILTSATIAQTPNAFKYQAVIRNNTGEIIANKSISVRISLLQGDVSGLTVYTETHIVSTNQFGLINLEIGNGTINYGNFTAINWGSNTYFVKIEIDTEGENNYTLLGTSQLLSVPYALYAETSKNTSAWRYNQAETSIQFRPDKTVESGIHLNKYPDLDIYSIGAYNWDPYNKHPEKLSIYAKHIYLNDREGFELYNIGIGTSRYDVPKAKLELGNGNFYISDNGGAIIMKSPNGSCWKITINDNGEFVKTAIPAP